MEDESQNAQLKAVKSIQTNMTKVLEEGPYIEALIQQLNPSNGSELTKKMIQIIGLIEEASPQIEKFSRKIIYASKQVTKEVDGNIVVETRQNGTKIQPFINENLGTLEHAIVEQIELIDSEKKETLSYEDLNEALSTRVFYTNKTLDLCIDYLLKKL